MHTTNYMPTFAPLLRNTAINTQIRNIGSTLPSQVFPDRWYYVVTDFGRVCHFFVPIWNEATDIEYTQRQSRRS